MQGVGFRPYVYRLAGELGLAGFVLNDARGVLLEVEGPTPRSTRFLGACAPRRRRWPLSSGSLREEREPTGARAAS